MKARLTRVETLIVTGVAVCAILIVWPLTSRARNDGRAVACMANLRMLTQAWLDYAADHDGKICNGLVPPDTQYATVSYWWSRGFTDTAWWVNPPHNAQGIYTGHPIPCPIKDELNGIRTGKLFAYMECLDIYHCPQDTTYLRTANRGGWRSYSITGLMNGEQPRDPKCVRRVHQMVNPGDKYVFLESTDPRGWNMGSWILDPYQQPPRWIDPVGVYHDGRSTFGFADGHAEIHAWVDKSTLDMAESGEFFWPVNWSVGEGQDIFYMVRGYVPGRR